MAAYLLSRYVQFSNYLAYIHNYKLRPEADESSNRIGDPIFALSMGVAAAFSRIRRDQQEKHPDKAAEIGYGSILQLGQHRLQRWWNGDFKNL